MDWVFEAGREFGLWHVVGAAVVILALIPFVNALRQNWRERKKVENSGYDKTLTQLDNVATSFRDQLRLEQERHKRTQVERDSYHDMFNACEREGKEAVKTITGLRGTIGELVDEITMHKADKIRLESEQKQANTYIGDAVAAYEEEIFSLNEQVKKLELELALCRQVERAGEAVRLVTIDEELLDGSDT